MFLTPREAAELLGLSVRQLAHLRRTGQGPDYYRFGRLVRYRLQDLLEWAETPGNPLEQSDKELSEES